MDPMVALVTLDDLDGLSWLGDTAAGLSGGDAARMASATITACLRSETRV
jgi:hypothetical protein